MPGPSPMVGMNPFQMMEEMEREFLGMHRHPHDDFFNRGHPGPSGRFGGGMLGGQSLFDEMDRLMEEQMMRERGLDGGP